MKKILLLVVLIASLQSCYQPERDCASFRTGTFEFQSYLNGQLVTTRFVRTDSIEIDSFQGKVDTSSIRWINDCEYILRNLHPENRSEEKPLHMKILTTEGKTYTFEYGLVGETRRNKGTAVKVK